jgi:hypothetical protein
MSRLFVDSTAVIECGYMNSASAEPSESEAYAHCAAPICGTRPFAGASLAAIASAFSSLKRSKDALALSKMPSQPPSCVGR